MKIQIRESILKQMIKEAFENIVTENEDVELQHFLNVIGRFVKQYVENIGGVREKSAGINLKLQLTYNPSDIIKEIIQKYNVDVKTVDGIKDFALNIFPKIVENYSNQNNINESKQNKVKKTIKLTESQLVSVISETVKKVMNENQLNEIFGFSQKEKDTKQLKREIQEAFNEIENMTFKSLFYEIDVNNNKTNITIRQASDFSLKRAGEYMPTVKKLLPELFSLDYKGGSNANSAKLKTNSGEYIYGIVPATFNILNTNREIDDEYAKHVIKLEICKTYQNACKYINGKFIIYNTEHERLTSK